MQNVTEFSEGDFEEEGYEGKGQRGLSELPPLPQFNKQRSVLIEDETNKLLLSSQNLSKIQYMKSQKVAHDNL